jgi:hypothetical protein
MGCLPNFGVRDAIGKIGCRIIRNYCKCVGEMRHMSNLVEELVCLR